MHNSLEYKINNMESASGNTTWVAMVDKLFASDNSKERDLTLMCLIKDIHDNHLKFHECVENLGKYLTDTNASSRAKGVQVLCDIILGLPVTFLNSSEVSKVILFLSDRLKDNVSVISQSLRGLQTLTARPNLSKDDINLILEGIFREIYTQSLEYKDRHSIFMILQNMLHFHLDVIKSIGLDFIPGFIQSIDGEKDPRNLIVIFNIIPVVICNLNIDPFIEDLFEVSACYFPVDYSPPPNDPRGIKKEDLVQGLRSVLSSTPKFAEHLIPLLLEKLDSDLNSAKLDTLQTLETCARVYGFDNLRTFYLDIWKSIRREVFSARSPEIENAALFSLTAVISTLGGNVLQRNLEDVGTRFLTDVLQECVSYLSQPDMKLLHPAAKLLKATAEASVTACEKVIRAALPPLLNHYSLKNKNHECRVILEVINTFLEVTSAVFSTVEGSSPLAEFKNPILKFYVGAVENNSVHDLRLSAIHGLLIMIQSGSLLTNNDLLSILYLLEKCAVQDDDESMRSTFRNALSKMADTHNLLITESLIPKILQWIESQSCENHQHSDEDLKVFNRHLKILTAVVRNDTSLAAVIPAIQTALEVFVEECNEIKTECFLQSLNEIAKNPSLAISASEYWYQNVILYLLHLVSRKITKCDHFSLLFVRAVGKINQTLVPSLTLRDSVELVLFILKAYLYSENSEDDDDNSAVKFTSEPFMILLVESVLNSAKVNTFNNSAQSLAIVNYIYRFLEKALLLINNPKLADEVVVSVARSISSLLNKLPNGEHLNHLATAVYSCIEMEYSGDPTSAVQIKRNKVQLLIWATKATCMRGHFIMEKFIELMFRYLADEEVSESTANGFQVILSDTPEALNSDLHARITLLYKQRFFLATSKQLMEGFHSANHGIACNYLTALVHQATRIPKEVFQNEVSMMMPIFIKGLLGSSSTLLVAILSTLLELLQDSPLFVESYVDTLIPYLLNLSSFQNSMKVRILSLECLACLIKLPTDITLKHKQDVIKNLTPALDDHKRLVRRAAMKTRSIWFLIGSPGGY